MRRLLLAALALLPAPLAAQPALLPAAAGPRSDAPVTFTADTVEYDEPRGIVSASGRVEAWQEGRVLRADRVTWNRNTGIATAEGNVVLIEPDGRVMFAESAELGAGFRDGVITGLAGLLAQNGRVVAAGARRTGGNLTDMARATYSSCDLCPDDPTAPPLWQLRSRLTTHDEAAQRIRHRDARIEVAGVPVLWTPYLSHPDPTVGRQSGFLLPTIGSTRFLGPFIETPYYWAIDETQDLTLSPTLSARQDPNLGLAYRRRFNFGEIEATGSLGWLNGRDTGEEEGFAGHIFSRGRFSLDENWRAGFSLNQATSQTYLRAFRIPVQRFLLSDVFTEGFWGPSGYVRVDAQAYQGLRETDDRAVIPLVMPNLFGEWVSEPDAWGGSFGVDGGAYAVFRDRGANSRRIASRLRYELPRTDRLGQVWTFRAQGDGIGYAADDLNEAPNFAAVSRADGAAGNFRAALDWRLPLVRRAGEYGTQLIEPRVQFVTGPAKGLQAKLPNEDSLDFEFTDANLFALSRFPGRDRQEGGTRVDAALRAAWMFPNGGMVEGLFGQSRRLVGQSSFEPGTGLESPASDYVARARIAPVPWLEFIGRTRLDRERFEAQLTDFTSLVTIGRVSFSAGYLFTTPSPVLSDQRSREEVSAGVSGRLTRHWRAGAFGRYDIGLDRPAFAGVSATYEDECLIFDIRFARNWAEDPTVSALYPSASILLFRIGFKTIGDFGFRAL
jgi:LPS-assembly protein